MIDATLADPDTDERECKRCGTSMSIPYDLEPTPLCNLCAQEIMFRLAVHALASEDTMDAHPALRKILDAGPQEATIDAAKRLVDELIEWRGGCEAAFGIVTATPRQTLVKLARVMAFVLPKD